MKNFTFLCLTVLVSLGTFAAPKYLIETGEEGDAMWDASVVSSTGATLVNLATAEKTLNEWINETFTSSPSGTDIWLAAGTYTLNGSISRSYSTIHLYGGFQGNETKTSQRSVLDGKAWNMQYPTIIDGGSTYQICSANFNGTWDGLKFQHGTGTNGGVARLHTNAVVRACAFINNSSTAKGGALYSYLGTDIQVSKCYFENNSSVRGGAVFVQGQTGNTYSLTNCTFKDNNATGTGSGEGGGAVSILSDGDYTVNACVFDHNNAYRGPAFLCSSTGSGINITISNCLFKNQQNSEMHAVYILKGAVLNCTFARNAGGAVYMSGGEESSGRIENNIVWGDNDTECKISITNTANYTLKNNALFKMYDPSNVDKADNKRLYASESDYFVDDANGDYHLSWKAKKMIGKGLDLTADGVTNDLDGKTRTLNDIGCYASSWDIYSRTVYPAQSAYGTLCIPKDVHAGEFEGATFYRIAGTISGRSELAIETVNALEAGHSYIFEIDPEATMIRLNQTGSAAPTPIADNGLYGTYQDIEDLSVHLGSLEDIYVVYNGEIRLAGASLTVPAKRAWIKMSEVRDALTEPQAQGSVRKRIPNASWQQGGATPLEQTMQTTGEEEIYDLLGRRVSSPVAGGIYIVNGQKVIIK